MAKRAFDIIVAGMALIVLSPLLAILALVVKLESPGSLLFRQPRVGKDGKVFTMYKFRTMRTDARAASGPATVPQVSDFTSYVFDPLYGGKRYTPIGRLLRSTSLDELLNLVNVLRGDLSFVGPRPEVPELVAQYPPQSRRRHRSPPA